MQLMFGDNFSFSLFESKGVVHAEWKIFYDEKGQAYIWKVSPEFQITRHPIAVGTMTNEGNIIIKTGLTTGDKLITAGVQTLTEGLKVREFTGTMGE